MKTKLRITTSLNETHSRLRWWLLLPLLATSLYAQPVMPEIGIECHGEGNAVLNWQDPGEEYIVAWASKLEGPWTPCLEPLTRESSRCGMALHTTGECKYFRVVRGQRFEDDFEDGDLDGWVILPENPLLLNYITVEAANGQLHIQGSPPGGISRRLFFTHTNMVLADFCAQIDILGWDDTSENQPVVALVGRIDPRILESPLYAYYYMGGVTVAPTGYPGQSSLWTWKQEGPGGGILASDIKFGPRMQPSANYRMVLKVFDNAQKPTGFVRLVDEDGDLIAENTATDNGIPLTQGLVGIYVHEQSQSGTVDFWLDNFVAVGTAP